MADWSRWRDELGRVAGDLGRLGDRALDRIEQAADRVSGFEGIASLRPYLGYGTRERLLVLGRVVRGRSARQAAATDSRWANLLDSWHRARAFPVANARLELVVGTERYEVSADDEGFVRQWLTLATPLAHDGTVRLPATLRLAGDVRATTEPQWLDVVVPGAARVGVISDLDDTVLQSHVTDFPRAVRTMLAENARTRLPFPGVAAFYAALARGAGAPSAPANPVFYVSSSPWNLHDLIADFMAVQKVPAGPLILRDWDLDRSLLGAGRHKGHKGARIREILATYPSLPFILVGDSGEQDPEIYAEIVHEHPGRILAVYIRDVSRRAERSSAIATLAHEVARTGSALVLAEDTLAAARHAAEHGWIDAAGLAEVERAMQ